jgi:hypothetical protein
MRLSTAMMRLGLVGFLALVPAARSVAQESPDEAIESKIEASLKKDSILAARSIDVESEHRRRIGTWTRDVDRRRQDR